jgi:predicted aconitase
MKLTDEEEALRAGEFGEAAQGAIEHQIKVGRYLGARDLFARTDPPRIRKQRTRNNADASTP